MMNQNGGGGMVAEETENIRNNKSDDDKFDEANHIVDEAVEETVDKEDNEEQASAKHGRCYNFMSRIGCKWLARMPSNFPRTFAFFFGVAGPIVLLIAISLMFGFFLAELEAPSEIEANNDVIASRAYLSFVTSFHRRVSTQTPSICLVIAARNQTTGASFDKAVNKAVEDLFVQNVRNTTTPTDEFEYFSENRTMSDLIAFTDKCVEAVWNRADNLTLDISTAASNLEDMSFSWVRCTGERGQGNSFSRLMGNYLRPPHTNITSLRPTEQEAIAVAAWTRQQKELLEKYQKEFLDDGMSDVKALKLAHARSLEEATGFESCEANPDAGAWFWFTIMTTIGYGNTAPTTTGGRAMVYTIGFLSILTFACVLSSSGHIITAIFDDWVDRVNFPLLHRTWAACLFWGAVYYGWMVVLAAVTLDWKTSRLGEDFEFRDAYWFSYITTTTVGLGDFYLEHQVLLRRDSIWFGFLILIGFIFLANFLVKLTEIITGRFPDRWRTLENKLAKTDMLWHPIKKRREKESRTSEPEGCADSSGTNDSHVEESSGNHDSQVAESS